ncbi:hypothetical protein [Pseudonocardia phyllosphaerae]|uniref:hypothetical protein n=1 Tax=Pseudonocardia phyllosphaerae TaxID=3390502 RepID=UPI003977EAF3
MSRILARLVAVALVIGAVVMLVKWLLITAAMLAVPFGLWWVIDRVVTYRRTGTKRAKAAAAAARRREVESRASVDATGGCGWCGTRVAHRDDAGALVHPLDHHRGEVEATLRGVPGMPGGLDHALR